MAKTYSLWKVQELVRRIQLEESQAHANYDQLEDSVSVGEVRAYSKALRIIKDIFGPDAVEKAREGKE